MDFLATDWWISTQMSTNPGMMSGLSTSVMSLIKVWATERSASSGHSENQSIVQHVTKLGNCRSLDLKISPIGLKIYIRASKNSLQSYNNNLL